MSGRAARWKHWAQNARVGAEVCGRGEFVLIVCGHRDNAVAARMRHQPMRPVHAVGANIRCELFIGRDQQFQRPRARDPAQHPRRFHAIFRAEMPVNNGRPARQPARHGARIGRARWISDEKQRRNGRLARLAVEPRRLRR